MKDYEIKYHEDEDFNDLLVKESDVESKEESLAKGAQKEVWEEGEKLRDFKDRNKKINFSVSQITPEGVMSGITENGVLATIKTKKIDGSYFSEKERMLLMGYKLRGYITYIDYDNKCVKLSNLSFLQVEKGNIKPRDELNTNHMKFSDFIRRGLEKDEDLKFWARIVGFDTQRKLVRIDIADKGVTGFIPMEEWDPYYIYNPENKIRAMYGKRIKVKALQVIFNSEDRFKGVICSRKACVDVNEWEGIERRFPRNTDVIVTCVERKERYYFAKTDTLEYINILCHYPDDDKTSVIEGGRYVVRISAVSEENRKLMARTKGYVDNETKQANLFEKKVRPNNSIVGEAGSVSDEF